MATNNAINQKRPTGFEAYLSAPTANNKTGNGAAYTVICDSILVTDGNYNAGTGVYTVPTTGRYLISANLIFSNVGAQTSSQVRFNNSGTLYIPWYTTMANLATGGLLALPAVLILQLTAATTLQLDAYAAGSTQTVGVYGGNAPFGTTFSCYLLG